MRVGLDLWGDQNLQSLGNYICMNPSCVWNGSKSSNNTQFFVHSRYDSLSKHTILELKGAWKQFSLSKFALPRYKKKTKAEFWIIINHAITISESGSKSRKYLNKLLDKSCLYHLQGMKYLHHREFTHGSLKSLNFVVDGHFVLKVTDYGFNDILEMLRLSQEKPFAEGKQCISPFWCTQGNSKVHMRICTELKPQTDSTSHFCWKFSLISKPKELNEFFRL